MRYCPGCGNRQVWTAYDIGSDTMEDTGDYHGWAISGRFAFSPWTGGEFESGLGVVKRVAGFGLTLPCPNECGGKVERYMNYCPSCGEGEPDGLLMVARRFVGLNLSSIVWNRKNNPGKQYLASALLSTDCDSCGWEISEKWMFCPWCGLERLVLPFRMQEAVDHIRRQITDNTDIEGLRKIEEHAIKNCIDGDFCETVHATRTFLENWLKYAAEANGMNLPANFGAGKIAFVLKQKVGPEHAFLFECAGYVIDIGNEGTHRRRKVSEASAVKSLESLNLFLERVGDIL